MDLSLNFEQKKALSSFFIGAAIAWFVVLFASPSVAKEINLLTLIQYLANMFLALFNSMYLLKD